LLDIVMRDRTDNRRSLDDLMREMNQDFAVTGKFYQDSLDVRLTAEKLTGSSLEDFFADYVSGAKQLPYTELLAKAGLALQERESVRAALGFAVQHETDGTVPVVSVDAGSSAEKSGLHVGDLIVSWNGGDVPRSPQYWVSRRDPGEPLHLLVRRDDAEVNMDLRLDSRRQTSYQVVEMQGANERARRIRDGLLHGSTEVGARR
jgi:predicted metalloprotease with PDZ domain